jgi:hypothetical protein
LKNWRLFLAHKQKLEYHEKKTAVLAHKHKHELGQEKTEFVAH